MRHQCSIRFPRPLLGDVDAHRSAIRAETGLEVTRTAAILALIRRGLDASHDPRPQHHAGSTPSAAGSPVA